jgi:hypothetical protein
VIFFIDQIPRFLPVVWVFLVPFYDVTDALVKLTALGDTGQARLHDFLDVFFKESRGVHAADELSAIETVPIIHQPSEDFPKRQHLVGHAGSDQAGEIGLDLIINVIGVFVVFRVARVGGGDPLAQVVSSVKIGVPEVVSAVGEVNSRLANRDIEPVFFKSLQKGHLDIDVILVVLVDVFGFPLRELVGRDDGPIVLNSVGAPQPTPAIWPIQPAFILSTYSLTGSRSSAAFCSAAWEAIGRRLNPAIRSVDDKRNIVRDSFAFEYSVPPKRGKRQIDSV